MNTIKLPRPKTGTVEEQVKKWYEGECQRCGAAAVCLKMEQHGFMVGTEFARADTTMNREQWETYDPACRVAGAEHSSG